jgi:hypothetical protein
MTLEAGSTPPVAPPQSLSRQFEVGTVITRTFSVWRSNVLTFSLLTVVSDLPIVAVSLVAGVPIPGMTAPNRNPFHSGQTPLAFPASVLFAYLATMLLVLVQVGAITQAVMSHLSGKRVSVPEMITAGLQRFFPMLGVLLFSYLMLVFGLVLLIVPGVFLACALSVTIPVSVLERQGIFGAIGRSFFLTKGHRLAIFATALIFFLIFITVYIFGSFMLPTFTVSFSPMLGTLLGLALNIAFGSLTWILPSVIYHDLRVAKEGLDPQQLSAVFD